MMEKLQQSEVPIAGVWLQDWVGFSHVIEGARLQWNWNLDPSHYPEWSKMVQSWSQKDIRVLTYVNPFFSPRKETKKFDKSKSQLQEGRPDYFKEGIQNGYFVKNKKGEAYLLKSGSLPFCMVDFTNPDASKIAFVYK